MQHRKVNFCCQLKKICEKKCRKYPPSHWPKVQKPDRSDGSASDKQVPRREVNKHLPRRDLVVKSGLEHTACFDVTSTSITKASFPIWKRHTTDCFDIENTSFPLLSGLSLSLSLRLCHLRAFVTENNVLQTRQHIFYRYSAQTINNNRSHEGDNGVSALVVETIQ